MLEVDEDDQPNDEGDEHDGGDNHGKVEDPLRHVERARGVHGVNHGVVVNTVQKQHNKQDALNR